MNILLLGSGGREHTLAWKLVQSPLCIQLYTAPGNPGTGRCGENVDLSPTNFEAVADFVRKRQIDMVVVGPEEPLVLGIQDFLRAQPDLSDLMIIGPSKAGAMLEGSKAFAKAFMHEFEIPTAAYREFNSTQLEEGLAFLSQQPCPIVLKADGLAAGKGVLICQTNEEAEIEFKAMLQGKFGNAGNTVVVEAFLDGIEFSVFVLTDGKDYKILPVAKDYKRIGEGDTGLNTGGMGAVSPVSFVNEALMHKVETRIVQPTIWGLKKRNIDYQGVIFIGLIRVNDAPFVIEYNCRLGDPETEVVLPRLQNDLTALFRDLAEGRLAKTTIREDPRFATTIMLVSGGYPEAYEKGKTITLPQSDLENQLIFHAGTRIENGELQTNGGRVLALTSLADSLEQALQGSKHLAETIDFEGKYFRRDIGRDLN